MSDFSEQAKQDLEILKLTRHVPPELENELLDALAEIYKLHEEGDPHPAKRAVKIIEQCPVKESI